MKRTVKKVYVTIHESPNGCYLSREDENKVWEHIDILVKKWNKEILKEKKKKINLQKYKY